MSGPNDSGSGDTPTGDATPPSVAPTNGQEVSSRFKLRIHWDTPRVEWGPVMASPKLDLSEPLPLQLGDPVRSAERFERYMASGGFLFDAKRPLFELIDKAFLDAPTEPPQLLPSFAQMKAWEDDAFYKRLGRSPPLFGAPAAPPPLLTPPISGPPPPSPFYKLPDPAAMQAGSGPPRAGKVGDALKALSKVPIVQENLNKVSDEGLRQGRLLLAAWSNGSFGFRTTIIVFTAPIAAGVVGTVFGAQDARNFAFKSLKGVDVPVPFVPGLSVHVDDFGKADPFLLGAKAPDPHEPQALSFGFKFDVLKAIPFVRKVF